MGLYSGGPITGRNLRLRFGGLGGFFCGRAYFLVGGGGGKRGLLSEFYGMSNTREKQALVKSSNGKIEKLKKRRVEAFSCMKSEVLNIVIIGYLDC